MDFGDVSRVIIINCKISARNAFVTDWKADVMLYAMMRCQDNDDASEARLLEEEQRRVQLQQQEDTLKVDLAIVQEREQGIRQLEVTLACVTTF